jgi:hypothetical protein
VPHPAATTRQSVLLTVADPPFLILHSLSVVVLVTSSQVSAATFGQTPSVQTLSTDNQNLKIKWLHQPMSR